MATFFLGTREWEKEWFCSCNKSDFPTNHLPPSWRKCQIIKWRLSKILVLMIFPSNNQDPLFGTKNPKIYGQWHYINSSLLLIPLRAHVHITLILISFFLLQLRSSTNQPKNTPTSPHPLLLVTWSLKTPNWRFIGYLLLSSCWIHIQCIVHFPIKSI